MSRALIAPVALAIAFAATGCQLTRVVEVDPAQVPAGSAEAMGGVEPMGPVTVIGSGESQGIGWRYSVYRSADGLCTQLETGSSAGAGCGVGPPEGDTIFGGLSSSGTADGATSVDGLVGGQVAEIAMLLVGGGREPAVLMSLERAGLEGQAFVGFAPRGATIEAVVALDDEGGVLETIELGP